MSVIEAEVVTSVQHPPLLPRQTLTLEKKAKFLSVLRDSGGNVSKSAEAIGIHRQTVYDWHNSDPQFAIEMNDALEAGTDYLEEVAYTRACSVSDTLAIFLLKARRPEKYRENIRMDVETNLSDNDVHRIGESLMSSLMEAANRRRAQQLAPAPESDHNP